MSDDAERAVRPALAAASVQLDLIRRCEEMFRNLLNEARARIENLEADAANDAGLIRTLKAEIARLTAPPGASAMERAEKVKNDWRFNHNTDDSAALIDRIAHAVEAAQREASARMLEPNQNALERMADAFLKSKHAREERFGQPLSMDGVMYEDLLAAIRALPDEPPSEIKESPAQSEA
jgi:hypothetical protein